MMIVSWEYPLEVIEDWFRENHSIQGEVIAAHAEYDHVGEAIIVRFDIDPEDAERLPDSDTDGTLLSIE